MELLQKEPEKGLSHLMTAYIGLVSQIVKGRLSEAASREDIEECISDVFCEFYLNRCAFDPARGTVKAYLCAIARNKAADLYALRCRESTHVSLDDPLSAIAVSDPARVDETFLTAQTRRELLDAIRSLGEPDREIIVRKYLLTEPSKSIAKRLHMTVSAVDTRAHRALGKLRKMLGGDRNE